MALEDPTENHKNKEQWLALWKWCSSEATVDWLFVGIRLAYCPPGVNPQRHAVAHHFIPESSYISQGWPDQRLSRSPEGCPQQRLSSCSACSSSPGFPSSCSGSTPPIQTWDDVPQWFIHAPFPVPRSSQVSVPLHHCSQIPGPTFPSVLISGRGFKRQNSLRWIV